MNPPVDVLCLCQSSEQALRQLCWILSCACSPIAHHCLSWIGDEILCCWLGQKFTHSVCHLILRSGVNDEQQQQLWMDGWRGIWSLPIIHRQLTLFVLLIWKLSSHRRMIINIYIEHREGSAKLTRDGWSGTGGTLIRNTGIFAHGSAGGQEKKTDGKHPPLLRSTNHHPRRY